jgi:linoleate 10R-lipoxygenase
MMLEAKVPTYIGQARLGAGGGVSVSEGGIGKSKIVAGGQGEPGQMASATVHPVENQQPTPAPSRLASDAGGSGGGGGGWGATSPAGISTVTPTSTSPPSVIISHSNGHSKPAGPSAPAPAPQVTVPQKAYSSAFRNPSGAGNNPYLPLLGAAGTAYARSVVPQHPIPPSTLPDPGMIFDLLMRRTPAPRGADPTIYPPSHPAYDANLAREFKGQGHGLPHPSGLSSLLFAFGDLIIHSVFRTSSRDSGVNLTSSYLDLSVLYGVDELEMQGVRRYDGTGRLWEDCWADPRIGLMSPQVGALLVIFCRNHNVSRETLLLFEEFSFLMLIICLLVSRSSPPRDQ